MDRAMIELQAAMTEALRPFSTPKVRRVWRQEIEHAIHVAAMNGSTTAVWEMPEKVWPRDVRALTRVYERKGFEISARENKMYIAW